MSGLVPREYNFSTQLQCQRSVYLGIGCQPSTSKPLALCSHLSVLVLSMSIVPVYQEALTNTEHGKSGPLPDSCLPGALESTGLPYCQCQGVSVFWTSSQLAGNCFPLHPCQTYFLEAGSCSWFSLVRR